MAHEPYDGPVCFQDGWHWTVVPDPDAREYAITVAQASLKHKQATGSPDDIAFAQKELDEITGHRVFEKPGQRLHLEDNEDGTLFRYRLATGNDERSWHDRKHREYAKAEFGMSTEELEQLLAERKKAEGRE